MCVCVCVCVCVCMYVHIHMYISTGSCTRILRLDKLEVRCVKIMVPNCPSPVCVITWCTQVKEMAKDGKRMTQEAEHCLLEYCTKLQDLQTWGSARDVFETILPTLYSKRAMRMIGTSAANLASSEAPSVVPYEAEVREDIGIRVQGLGLLYRYGVGVVACVLGGPPHAGARDS